MFDHKSNLEKRAPKSEMGMLSNCRMAVAWHAQNIWSMHMHHNLSAYERKKKYFDTFSKISIFIKINKIKILNQNIKFNGECHRKNEF